jgi:hypothetical protein
MSCHARKAYRILLPMQLHRHRGAFVALLNIQGVSIREAIGQNTEKYHIIVAIASLVENMWGKGITLGILAAGENYPTFAMTPRMTHANRLSQLRKYSSMGTRASENHHSLQRERNHHLYVFMILPSTCYNNSHQIQQAIFNIFT